MKTKNWLALVAVLALLAAAAVAVGCGDDEGPTEAAGGGSGNAADAAFVEQMTAHHEGAIEMARIARSRAEHAEIRELADAIVAAQESEIGRMKTISADLPDADGDVGMSEADMGMDMDAAHLEYAEPFDRAFIDMMVPHHEGAIEMAEQLLEAGRHPELRAMAQEIIDAQGKEIDQMRDWRKSWYGSADGPADPMQDHGH